MDIPGAFIQAGIDELVDARMTGLLAELFVKLDPKLNMKFYLLYSNSIF